jgi:hypothetical protein
MSPNTCPLFQGLVPLRMISAMVKAVVCTGDICNMNQRERFCDQVPKSCIYGGSEASFLALPSPIRHRIYENAGLFTNEEIELPILAWQPAIWHMRNVTSSLLRVCRLVHDEVEDALYSRNTFRLAGSTVKEALLYLGKLSPRACARMQDLVVCLSFPSWGADTAEYPLWGLRDVEDCPDVCDSGIVDQWRVAISRILAFTIPGQLRLRLACETTDIELSRAILAPLHLHPGKLGDLKIIFSWKHHPELVALAKYAVQQLIHKGSPSSSPFRFFDLPPEVRWNVFRYTELAMPLGEVQWTPHRGFEVACTACSCSTGAGCGEVDTIHLCREVLTCPARVGRYPCCSQKQSAASVNCYHWQGPLPLMLVSRAMNAEATAFFYSHNRVTILPRLRIVRPNGRPSIVYDFPQENALALFVRRLATPSDVLRHLRRVEVIYPGLDVRTAKGLQASALAFRQSWWQAVDDLARYANVPGLTLAVHLYKSPVHPFYDDEGHALPFVSESDLHAVYGEILAPLRALTRLGMRRLFVHLEWPSNYSSPRLRDELVRKRPHHRIGVDREFHWVPGANARTVEAEENLERFIMGMEYESSLRGKDVLMPSQTLRCLWDGRAAQNWARMGA